MQISKVPWFFVLLLGAFAVGAQTNDSANHRKAEEALRRTSSQPMKSSTSSTNVPVAGEKKILDELKKTESGVAAPAPVPTASKEALDKALEALRRTAAKSANASAMPQPAAAPAPRMAPEPPKAPPVAPVAQRPMAPPQPQVAAPTVAAPEPVPSPVMEKATPMNQKMSPAQRRAKEVLERVLREQQSKEASTGTAKPSSTKPAAKMAPAEKAPASKKASSASQPSNPTATKKSTTTTKAPSIETAPVESALAESAGPKTREEKLKELNQQYLDNKLTPAEYHERRAKILAEPQPK